MQKSRTRRFIKHGTLPQLMVFEAVARLGSHTRAAAELFMAQPTVSVQIKKLTHTMGMPLFDNFGKRIHLTEAGRELYTACGEIFLALDGVENRLTGLRDLKSGRLQIAASGSISEFTTSMLAGFVAKHQHIDVALHVHHRKDLLERLAENVDDLYVLSNPPQDSKTIKQAIFQSPLLVYASADHSLASVSRIPFERIAKEPFLMREVGSGTRMVVERMFAERGIKPSIRMELGSNDAVRHAIAAGLGVSILSRCGLSNRDGRYERIVALDVVGFPLERHWYFVYPPGKQPSLVTQTFVAFVQDRTVRHVSKGDRRGHAISPRR